MEAFKVNHYKGVIRECFSSDGELLNKWHISAPANVDICTNKTFEDLKEAINFEFYELREQGQTAGFIGVEKRMDNNFLTGFFLKPDYRKEENKNEFWGIVKDKAGDSFSSAIHPKNIRADKFLSKQPHSRMETKNYILFNIQLHCQ